LGASNSAFSFDPSTGDIVNGTKSISGGLPRLETGSGVVELELVLPRSEGEASATFVVNGERCPAIELPASVVVTPAVCFLAQQQKISISVQALASAESETLE
jgi:hypothetical protein